MPGSGARGVDARLRAARLRYRRVSPLELVGELAAGALLIDTRPAALREQFGTIRGAIALERNVLEWRLDPTCDARIVEADGWDRRIVLHCQEGYASSLAVASLLDLGLTNITDLDGGIAAWRDAGLPLLA